MQAQASVPQHSLTTGAAQNPRHPQPAGLCPSTHGPSGMGTLIPAIPYHATRSSAVCPCLSDAETPEATGAHAHAAHACTCRHAAHGCGACCCCPPRLPWAPLSGTLSASLQVGNSSSPSPLPGPLPDPGLWLSNLAVVPVQQAALCCSADAWDVLSVALHAEG